MRSHTLFMFLAVLAGLGCSDNADDAVTCTGEFRTSVRVTVLDGDTQVTDATVKYSVDGSAPRACESFGTEYECGGEQAGDFLITARKDGKSGSVEVTVHEDECHVLTEDVVLHLEPAADD